MDRPASAIVVGGAVIGLVVAGHATCARGQLRLPPAQAPCSVLGGRPCHPSFCGALHRGPCFPDYQPLWGEDLRLTIVSTDRPDSAGPGDSAAAGEPTPQQAPLDTIAAMFAALRACWVPPPRQNARHGMEYTVRFALKHNGELVAPPRRTYSSREASPKVRDAYRNAVAAALKRCTPRHFSNGMAGAVAGRPIAVRFVDDRTW